MVLRFLFLLVGCSSLNEDVAADLLPGMWSGHIEIEQENYIDLDTDMHIQLFEGSQEMIVGWFYHTDGVYLLQGEYPILHCEEIYITGDLIFSKDGTIKIDCLNEPDGATCLDFEGTKESAQIRIKNLFINSEATLDQYEEIGDRALENFQCIY